MIFRALQLAISIACISGLTPAVQDSVSGTWAALVPAVVRNEDGVQTVESTTNATFTLEVRGDSVFGTLTRDKAPTGRPFRGTVRGNQVVLVGTTRVRAYVDGVDHELGVVTTYRFTRAGDTMTGTSETALDPTSEPKLSLPGVEQAPLPVTATRVKP